MEKLLLLRDWREKIAKEAAAAAATCPISSDPFFYFLFLLSLFLLPGCEQAVFVLNRFYGVGLN